MREDGPGNSRTNFYRSATNKDRSIDTASITWELRGWPSSLLHVPELTKGLHPTAFVLCADRSFCDGGGTKLGDDLRNGRGAESDPFI